MKSQNRYNRHLCTLWISRKVFFPIHALESAHKLLNRYLKSLHRSSNKVVHFLDTRRNHDQRNKTKYSQIKYLVCWSMFYQRNLFLVKEFLLTLVCLYHYRCNYLDCWCISYSGPDYPFSLIFATLSRHPLPHHRASKRSFLSFISPCPEYCWNHSKSAGVTIYLYQPQALSTFSTHSDFPQLLSTQWTVSDCQYQVCRKWWLGKSQHPLTLGLCIASSWLIAFFRQYF